MSAAFVLPVSVDCGVVVDIEISMDISDVGIVAEGEVELSMGTIDGICTRCDR